MILSEVQQGITELKEFPQAVKQPEKVAQSSQ